MPSSSVPVSLPAPASLEHLRKQAKDLRDALRVGDPAALARVQAHLPARSQVLSSTSSPVVSLSEAQFVVAREYGFASWPRLKRHVESSQTLHQTEAAQDTTEIADAWNALLRADPDLSRLPDAETQAIPPIRTAQWRESSTRWGEPGDEEHSRQMQNWIRFYSPSHAWHSGEGEDWSHDVMDERSHMHTASSWDMCSLHPHPRPMIANNLLRKVVFWRPETEERGAGSVLQWSRDTWQQEIVEMDGQPLVRWHQETIEANFRVAQSIWTEAATRRIVRQERRETNVLTGRDACFVVNDQYVYNVEPPVRTFEMPIGKPIITDDDDISARDMWKTLTAKQRQRIRDTLNQSDTGWSSADFAAFAGAWEFGMTSHLPSEAEWRERVQRQEGQWRAWNSEIESADTQTYLPVNVTTDTVTLMTVKDEILCVEAKLRVTWDDTENLWEGESVFFLWRKGRGYKIVHWECPWAEIQAARTGLSTLQGSSAMLR